MKTTFRRDLSTKPQQSGGEWGTRYRRTFSSDLWKSGRSLWDPHAPQHPLANDASEYKMLNVHWKVDR